MIRVNLLKTTMAVDAYRPICNEMLIWLREKNISYFTMQEDWVDLPLSVYITDEMEACLFKLTFGL